MNTTARDRGEDKKQHRSKAPHTLGEELMRSGEGFDDLLRGHEHTITREQYLAYHAKRDEHQQEVQTDAE